MLKVYAKNQFIHSNEPAVSLFDKGFLYGDGLFATLLISEGIPLFFYEAYKKLQSHAKEFNIDIPEADHVIELVKKLISINNAFDNFWRLRLIFTRGDLTDNSELSPFKLQKGDLFLSILPYKKSFQTSLKVTFFPHPFYLCHAKYKTLANLNRLYVKTYAEKNSFDDAITTTESNLVLETSFGNIFWIINNDLYTPSVDLPLHKGNTLNLLINSSDILNLKVHYVKTPRNLLPKNAHYFRCSSLTGLIPIDRIDNQTYQRLSHLEKKLQNWFETLVLKEKEKFSKKNTLYQ